jgi:quinohemoprotein ethanol dehydrogenase
MKRSSHLAVVAAGALCALAGLLAAAQPPGPGSGRARATSAVDQAALIAAESRPGDWLSYGRTYKEQRFSPLDQIDDGNVSELGIAWIWETGTNRGLEATPLVVDGVLYATGSWSIVFALDAVTGEPLWTYDPEVPREYAKKACCDVVNRGAALYRGKVYVATLDGRLIALDADSGQPVWTTQTFDQSEPYTSTGAPRVVKGKVIIGNGGAEYGVRGYVSAYDAETGELAWRFWTVPGNPADGFENAAMEMAAKTWNGKWWEHGGGGTVWDSFVYDPELDLLYVGVGNGSPWNQNIRSPGGGDNLFLSSIVALRPDTGEYVWHYQTTPGDTWDYTATQPIVLAELPIDGRVRKVLMQAPKNGFFYVLDRATGELISAEKYVTVSWASHVDLETGRPVELPGARFTDSTVAVFPGPFGGHNWHPMAYNPETQLVYIPAMEMSSFYVPDQEFERRKDLWNLGVVSAAPEDIPEAVVQATGVPADVLAEDAPPEMLLGHLLAWDPVAQKEVWRAQYDMPWSGGVLTTAGNLVFQGTPYGMLRAYRATDGELLWESYTGSGVIAPPVTFEAAGKQYVAVLSGWGGAFGMVGTRSARKAGVHSDGRMVVYALGEDEEEPQRPAGRQIRLTAIPYDESAEAIALGRRVYNTYCLVCHGYGAVGGGVTADLRESAPRVFEAYDQILLEGARVELGMPSFREVLDAEAVKLIRNYVLHRRAKLIAEEG